MKDSYILVFIACPTSPTALEIDVLLSRQPKQSVEDKQKFIAFGFWFTR